jgi:hypothetical protein
MSHFSRTKHVALLAAAFFAGCAAEAHIMIPAARAGTNPQRWEYACVRADEGVTQLANEHGQQGWELAAAAGEGSGTGLTSHEAMIWCFKRPLP